MYKSRFQIDFDRRFLLISQMKKMNQSILVHQNKYFKEKVEAAYVTEELQALLPLE